MGNAKGQTMSPDALINLALHTASAYEARTGLKPTHIRLGRDEFTAFMAYGDNHPMKRDPNTDDGRNWIGRYEVEWDSRVTNGIALEVRA